MNLFTPSLTDGRTVDDRLSPILIKELRQGMRARAFVLSFLLIQVFLIVLVLGNIAAQNDRNTLNSQNGFFWGIVGVALLVLMPFRGLAAITSEVKHNTIETILLTRMTAWRIVFGKWSALFAQSLLFVTAVLPYVVLRYFIGGQDVVSDFEWLMFLLWLSGLMIAAAITISALNNAVIRIIIIVVAVPMTLTLEDTGLLGRGSGRWDFWETIGWLAIFGFFVPALLFEVTASSIAPASENHAIRRRLLALLFFVLAIILMAVTHDPSRSGIAIPMAILLGVCYYELSEKPRLMPRLLLPFQRWGIPSRIFGVFLLPGWPSALLYSLVFIPLAILTLANFDTSFNSGMEGWAFLLTTFAIFGSVLIPILVCHLFWPKMKQVFLMIVLYNVGISVLASLLQGFASLTKYKVTELLIIAPSVPVLITNLNDESLKEVLGYFVFGNALVLGIVLFILLTASRSYFGQLWAMMKSHKTAPGKISP